MDDLDELAARVELARAETEQLRLGLSDWVNTHIDVWSEPFNGMTAVKVRAIGQVPLALRAKAGLITNELRTCLDGLTTQLARRHGDQAASAAFPIAKSAKAFTERRRELKLLAQEDQQTIAALLPWKGGNTKLYALHAADIQRKHVALNVQVPANGGISRGNGYTDVAIWKPGGPLGARPLTIGLVGPKSDVEIKINFDVTYDSPKELAGRRVIDFLTESADLVAEIIGRFRQPAS